MGIEPGTPGGEHAGCLVAWGASCKAVGARGGRSGRAPTSMPARSVAPASPTVGIRARHGRRRTTGRVAPVVALAAAVVLLVSACISSSTGGQELKGKGDRSAPNREFLAGGVASTNAFGIDLYRVASTNPGNFAYSPFAVINALGMARAGSAGTTRAQFDTVLHTNLGPDLDGGLNTLGAGLAERPGDKRSDTRLGRVGLEFATSLWGQRGNHVKDDLLDLLARDYGTGFRVTDFRSDPESGRQAVNHWAAEATHNRVEELVPRGEITQYTRFLATAAMDMQAPWQQPFDPKLTRTAPFQRNDDQPVTARMMQLTAATGLRYASRAAWQAVEIPYLGDELALDVIVPADGQFAAFEQGFSPEQLTAITDSLTAQPIDLHLPQFQFTTAASLHDPLTAQGLGSAFSTDADFPGVTTDEMLSLSDVIYQGFFGVNEEGTDAPTTTATVQPATDPSVAGLRTVQIDRPFLFVVRDRTTGAAILIGRVVNPN